MIRFSCPGCNAVLEHAVPGANVACPTCGQAQEVPGPDAEEDLPEVVMLPGRERPYRSRGAARYCPACGASVHARDRYCPECDAGLPRRRRRDYEPHRGNLVMILGILSLIVAPIILGPIAWYMATEDLKKIKDGQMDPEGESPTNTGRICGMIGTILGVVGLVVACVFFAFWMSLFSAILGSVPRR